MTLSDLKIERGSFSDPYCTRRATTEQPGEWITISAPGAGHLDAEITPPIMHIGMIDIPPWVQRQGIGKLMMYAAEREALRKGCTVVRGDAWTGTGVPFCRRLGYHIGGRSKIIDGALTVRKKLSPATLISLTPRPEQMAFAMGESPDNAYPGGYETIGTKRLSLLAPDARVFGFYKGRLLVADKPAYNHYTLLLYIGGTSLPDDPADNWAKYRKARELMQPCGRAWLQHKFMSFWTRETDVSPQQVKIIHQALGGTDTNWMLEFLGDIQVPMMDFVNQPTRRFLGMF